VGIDVPAYDDDLKTIAILKAPFSKTKMLRMRLKSR